MQKVPFLRHSMAKTLYERMLKDDSLRNMDTSKWYQCNLEAISPVLRDKFVPMNLDEPTRLFIDTCFTKSEWIFLQIFHSIARMFLSLFMTKTSINGLLKRGSMFVYSQDQFLSLMDTPFDWHATSLLDLGAGDGMVTESMASSFDETLVTEASGIMETLLSKKGYKVLGVDQWSEARDYYDVISCLNLLDRCDHPLSLLSQIRGKLRPGTGKVVVALVLPLSQYVESGTNKNHKPVESIHVNGTTFEEQLAGVAEMFSDQGYDVLRWTRLPYLCEGDLEQAFFWLNDAVFILTPKKL